MRRWLLPISCVLALTAAGAAFAQSQTGQMGPPPVSGVIKSVSASELVLTTQSGDVSMGLTAQTRVLARLNGSADDIQPGVYLGTSNLTAQDGVSNQATEVHVMANGPNVERQMDPQNNPALMMTNGHVTAVQSTSRGKEMDVDYGGSQTRHVVVTQDTTMTRMQDVGVAGLHAGMQVSARTTQDAQGHQVATYVSVAPPRS